MARKTVCLLPSTQRALEKDLELLASDEEQKRRYRECNLSIRVRATKRPREKDYRR